MVEDVHPTINRVLARFVDREIEARYRDQALPGQRNRALVIAGAVIIFPSINLLHEIPRFLNGDAVMMQLFGMRLCSVLSSLSVAVYLLWRPTGRTIEAVLAAYGTVLVAVSFGIGLYQGSEFAPVGVVGAVAFIYFFAPVQLLSVVMLGLAMSVSGWLSCVAQGLSPDNTLRLALWLFALNVVGYAGANTLNWTLRRLFWEKTRLAEQKRQMEVAYEREREAFRRFKQFAELISHEFRNPLAVVKSKAQLLQLIAEMGAPADLDALPAIERAVDRLDSMFNLWLSQDRLAESDFLPQARRVEVAEIFRQAAAEAPDSLRHPIAWDAREAGMAIFADPTLIQLVLSNLIDNAVKYSPDGGAIIVSAWREDDAVVISVQDHGVGLSPEHLERVFDKYFRVSQDGGVRGFGLGLFLVRRIVNIHGGTVALSSVLGQGTAARLRFPAIDDLPVMQGGESIA